MEKTFPALTKKLGFGCMRLPMKDGEIDLPQFSAMIRYYLDAGFCYFDTAHPYHGGKSETAIRACLTSQYPRDAYLLTDKLTGYFFKTQEDIRPLFEKQLALCGVDYFDFYLMHSQGKDNYPHFRACRAYETALELKAEGKIRHFGISFHDTAEVLEQILLDYPQIEVVQIQLNYVDYDDPAVQSAKLLEVCRRFGKPVIVMEPVKGGSLAVLPEDARSVFAALQGGSPAEYAIRFAAGCDGVMLVLSGMSDLAQLQENIGYMGDFHPLDTAEKAAVEEVCRIFRSKNVIPCTGCRYCTPGCPKGISIPDLFACMNNKTLFGGWNADFYYNDVHTLNGRKASDCLRCGRCEAACPQHLPIRRLLQDVAATFEKPAGHGK